jgi:iduronate 2-sulfatase
MTLAATLPKFADAEITKQDRPNVLFIAVDDLRPSLGCYGDALAKTPNIDRLANSGLQFNRAYCQEAVCSPSRASLLTGRRPDSIGVWDLRAHFRETVPDVVTLPQHFKNHGYHTRALGKILHGGGPPSQDPPSWSEAPMYDTSETSPIDKSRYALPKNMVNPGHKMDSLEAADVSDNAYTDGLVCQASLNALKELKERPEPFFLAVGFRKPHLPFCAPKKYWDLYKRDEIPPPATNSHPEGAPELAVRSWREIEGYADIPSDGMISVEKARDLRHGYYACVSYIDALVGKLLAELKRLGLDDDTVVVLWGDHGFHLGEQGLWTKANNYELSTHVPLILSVPGQPNAGATSEALVEFVDLYPTLAEACGLPLPEGLEGISMMPLLEDPARPWKSAAFSQYPRARESNRHKGHGDIMGYALRTKRFRYVEWQEWETGKVEARELYDHSEDADESKNIASSLEHTLTVEKLSKQLKSGWQAALPPGQKSKRSY